MEFWTPIQNLYLSTAKLNNDLHFSDGKNAQFARIQYECIRCLKAIMNSTVGLKQMFGQKEALTVIARSLDITKPSVMLEAVKVLAAVSLIPPNGHEKALEAITMSADIENRCRFLPIVQGLKSIGNEVLRVSRFFLFLVMLSLTFRWYQIVV